ncbi:Uncharacterized protein APZ42_032998 [Daphnia magna]|uniref:Uncharacterized protein n=1 Tax=Daphnia magna TaxID=35525 RepID=A0A162F268_9CRUS|nr:Uncharacterized protein APZ42_032998 [Daphnia magna]
MGIQPQRSNATQIQHNQNAATVQRTFSVAKADAVQRRVHAITRLSNKEVFLEIIDAPREEIRRRIIEKLGTAAWDYHPKLSFSINDTTGSHCNKGVLNWKNWASRIYCYITERAQISKKMAKLSHIDRQPKKNNS